jgi:ubiquinone biosynthesis protein
MRNPSSVLLLTRAFLIAEALMRSLNPGSSALSAFEDELKRLAVGRYAPSRIASATRRFGLDVERFLEQAPSDLRRSLRRLADGEIGRIRAPDVEETGRHMARGIKRLTGAVAAAAFLIAGSLLVVAGGWHRPLGDVLLAAGILGSIAVAVSALRGR